MTTAARRRQLCDANLPAMPRSSSVRMQSSLRNSGMLRKNSSDLQSAVDSYRAELAQVSLKHKYSLLILVSLRHRHSFLVIEAFGRKGLHFINPRHSAHLILSPQNNTVSYVFKMILYLCWSIEQPSTSRQQTTDRDLIILISEFMLQLLQFVCLYGLRSNVWMTRLIWPSKRPWSGLTSHSHKFYSGCSELLVSNLGR